MSLSDLTHVQFLVLTIIGGIERSGREVRERLAEQGEQKTLAAFYQIMAGLEDADLVEGAYRHIDIGGQSVRERWYKVTGAGLKAWHRTRDSYPSRGSAGLSVPGGAYGI